MYQTNRTLKTFSGGHDRRLFHTDYINIAIRNDLKETSKTIVKILIVIFLGYIETLKHSNAIHNDWF